MDITLSKILAVVLTTVYVIIAVVMYGPEVLYGVPIAFLPPLALIWFAEPLGEMTGYVGRGGTINQTSPPSLVAGFGWLALIAIPAYQLMSM